MGPSTLTAGNLHRLGLGQPVRYAAATGGAASWWLATPRRRWLA